MSHIAIATVTPDQMSQVDNIMADELGVDGLQLMEIAGLAVATWARERFLHHDARGRAVVVLAGSGGNGGDGMVAARFLHAWGAQVTVILSHSPAALHGAADHQARSLAALRLPLLPPERAGMPLALPPADLLIDGLLGFGLSGPPRGAAAGLIAAANAHPAPLLAIDLPSGLNARTGDPFTPCIRATSTLTLALPKTGLLAPAARPFIGELALADIGVPPQLYARFGLDVGPLFSAHGILRVMGS